MPFGLTNAPATFQDIMNYILQDLLDRGVVVYIDNILIYANDQEEYVSLVEVLRRVAENDLVISPEKCVSNQEEVEFLGYIIMPRGIKLGDDKVQEIQEWRKP
jgi:hypothetical protein